MNELYNIDTASELIKNIIEINRCTVCDKSIGKRMRYPCGHTCCEDCVPATESCPFCLSPQESSTFVTPEFDEPCTLRSQNAYNLLNAFQAEFNIDVYIKPRLSEQLKVEKQLFPHCIQAPFKYCNKRKSLTKEYSTFLREKYTKSFTENKENTAFPGEKVSFLSEMETSNTNVQEWLDNCVQRKPFADLNNTKCNKYPLGKRQLKNQNVLIDKALRKRNHADIWSDENRPLIGNQPSPIKIRCKKKPSARVKNAIAESSRIQKANKDDSGIAVDDEVIVINDPESMQVDKDVNAYLAVLEAENNTQFSTTDSKLNETKNAIQPDAKVHFYKKSSLSKNCQDCCDYYENKEKLKEPQEVSITIDNNSFTAVINVSTVNNNIKTSTKQSVEVQTNYNDKGSEKIHTEEGYGSDDIFLGETDKFPMNPIQKSVNKHLTSNVVIEETDSDEDIEQSTSLTVKADVHRSWDDKLILGDVEDVDEHSRRPRRAARGHTPASTDSSEKENYNPNRQRRTTNLKKKALKK